MDKTNVVLAWLLFAAAVDGSGRCLFPDTPSEPKHFYYGESAVNLRIFTTDRLTHRLVSTILEVFAEDVLGYQNVSLVQLEDPRQGFDPDAQFAYISSCTDPR